MKKGKGEPKEAKKKDPGEDSWEEKKTKNLKKKDVTVANVKYDVRCGGLGGVMDAVKKGTDQVKHILTEECDFIMECRVCRNIFRSLPNFLNHKMNFCSRQFNLDWTDEEANEVASGKLEFNVNLGPGFGPRNEVRSSDEVAKTGGNAVVNLELEPVKLQSGQICSTIGGGGGAQAVIVKQNIVCDDPTTSGPPEKPVILDKTAVGKSQEVDRLARAVAGQIEAFTSGDDVTFGDLAISLGQAAHSDTEGTFKRPQAPSIKNPVSCRKCKMEFASGVEWLKHASTCTRRLVHYPDPIGSTGPQVKDRITVRHDFSKFKHPKKPPSD